MSLTFNRSLPNLVKDWKTFSSVELAQLAGSIEVRLASLENQRADVDAAINGLTGVGLDRINEVLAPAFELVLRVQEKGFLVAESSSSTEINVNDTVILILDNEDLWETFTPSPYVYLTRASTTDDRALVRRVSYDAEIGEFVGIVEVSWGDPGPHDDWVIEGAAGSGLATLAARDQAIAARDAAEGHAEAALGSAGAASGSAGAASTSATNASGSATWASKWAAEAENVEVSGGLFSARHYALKAAASAGAAASFDPESYYLKTQVDDFLGEKADAAAVTAALAGKADAAATTSALAGKASTSDLTAARAELVRGEIRLAMQIADLKNTLSAFGNGVSDTFDDSTGIDAAGSTNESSASGYYFNPGSYVTEGTQSIPAMTSDTLPSGHVASADSVYGSGYEAYRAFDASSNYWIANGKTLPKWIRRQHPAMQVGGYSLKAADGAANEMPVAWTFEGSNNGTSWTTLDTRSGQTWSSGQTKSFTVTLANRASFAYHRINVTTAGSGEFVMIDELVLLKDTYVYQTMDLRSVAYTALSAPAAACLSIAAKAIGGTITVNTHLKGYVSRDNGTTWTLATLAARETLSDGTTIYEADDIDISAQPSGTQMKWRAETGSAFEVQVHAVGLYWR